jgi:hypothetical protein
MPRSEIVDGSAFVSYDGPKGHEAISTFMCCTFP